MDGVASGRKKKTCKKKWRKHRVICTHAMRHLRISKTIRARMLGSWQHVALERRRRRAEWRKAEERLSLQSLCILCMRYKAGSLHCS